MSDIEFAEGIYFNERKDNAPDFVLGSISINVNTAPKWIAENGNDKGYVNLDVKRSKAGKVYVAKNTWVPGGTAPPGQAAQPALNPQEEDFDDDIPF